MLGVTSTSDMCCDGFGVMSTSKFVTGTGTLVSDGVGQVCGCERVREREMKC